MLGVLGGSGGIGASTFAAVLALCAGTSVLIDLDHLGGGIDVLLGIESVPGARWSGLRLSGGRLDPRALAEGLPCWRRIPVLAADTRLPSSGAVTAVVGAAAAVGTVVLALPREPSPVRAEALAACLLTVLLVRGDVCGIASAAAVAADLSPARSAAVVTGAELPGAEVAELVGVPLLAVVRRPGRRGPAPGRPPRRLVRVARGIAEGLP